MPQHCAAAASAPGSVVVAPTPTATAASSTRPTSGRSPAPRHQPNAVATIAAPKPIALPAPPVSRGQLVAMSPDRRIRAHLQRPSMPLPGPAEPAAHGALMPPPDTLTRL
jgi:hypothetical protein